MTKKLCECCGRPVKIAFGMTRYCTGCAIHNRDLGARCNTLEVTRNRQRKRIRELKSKIRELQEKLER